MDGSHRLGCVLAYDVPLADGGHWAREAMCILSAYSFVRLFRDFLSFVYRTHISQSVLIATGAAAEDPAPVWARPAVPQRT